jgi:hypothetical protein
MNANQYANDIAIFSNDGWAARRFEREVRKVREVRIDIAIPVPAATFPFGSRNSSPFGNTGRRRSQNSVLSTSPLSKRANGIAGFEVWVSSSDQPCLERSGNETASLPTVCARLVSEAQMFQ